MNSTLYPTYTQEVFTELFPALNASPMKQLLVCLSEPLISRGM